MPITVSGRVTRRADDAPLSGAPVRLVALADALAATPGAQPFGPASWGWTRQIAGFAGTRWNMWERELKGKVGGLAWEQFCDPALVVNPHLQPDRLFKPDQTYLVPENSGRPYAHLDTLSAADGSYAFALEALPGVCALLATAPGLSLSVVALVEGNAAVDLALNPAAPASLATPAGAAGGAAVAAQPLPIVARGSVRSTRADYAALPEVARRLIDGALAMLGNDADSFDALPPALQRMCYGYDFLHNPADPHYKDICCGDLVGVALAGAGLDVRWSAYSGNTRRADYYHPHNGDGKLVEVNDPNDYLPGDIFVFGNGDPEGTAKHVALYVGPFEGTDRSGNAYPAAKRCEVVEGSLDTGTGATRKWTTVRGFPLAGALNGEYGTFSWVRRVRLRQLAEAFGR